MSRVSSLFADYVGAVAPDATPPQKAQLHAAFVAGMLTMFDESYRIAKEYSVGPKANAALKELHEDMVQHAADVRNTLGRPQS